MLPTLTVSLTTTAHRPAKLLFALRTPKRDDPFAWVHGSTHVIGVTPIDRATVTALRLNNGNVVEARSIWIEFGCTPQKLRLKAGSVMLGDLRINKVPISQVSTALNLQP